MTEQCKTLFIAALLSVASIATSIACVYARHESRKLFTQLQYLNSERDALEVEWSQLKIEQSTWSTHSRVEEKARLKMHMRNPDSTEIRIISQ